MRLHLSTWHPLPCSSALSNIYSRTTSEKPGPDAFSCTYSHPRCPFPHPLLCPIYPYFIYPTTALPPAPYLAILTWFLGRSLDRVPRIHCMCSLAFARTEYLVYMYTFARTRCSLQCSLPMWSIWCFASINLIIISFSIYYAFIYTSVNIKVF